ncbi:MAG TPA: hypothetical protein VN802_04950 [Stellaceae bacterium]|nr:hypothetical protein [Stellaceae bacterium]
MDIEELARLYALELLVTQLIGEQLEATPDPQEQCGRARWQLGALVEKMRFADLTLDDEARLRLRVRERVFDVLDTANRRAIGSPT